MPKRIKDAFTGRTDVSRQRRWQLRKIAAGKCLICGRRRIPGSAQYCKLHLGRMRIVKRLYMRKYRQRQKARVVA